MAGEKNFEGRVKAWLESEGIYPLDRSRDKMKATPCGYYEKRWAGGRFATTQGKPDMHIVVRGRSLDAELKGPGGHPSPMQLRCIKYMKTSGCLAAVFWPEDFEKLKAIVLWLKDLGGDGADATELFEGGSV
ncbi:MAG: hypothetical protein RR619_09680 [Raoultibacter sp.]